MYGYKIKFNSLPVSLWACATTVTDYMWENRHNKNMIEISVSSFTKKTRIINGKTYVVHGNDISCIVGDDDVKCFCETNSPISITSVAVMIPDLECTKCEFGENDFRDESVILLPQFINNPPDSLNLYAIKALHNMIKYNLPSTEVMKKVFAAEFIGLLCEIDRAVRNIDEESKSNYYIKRIDRFIDDHYSEKISLKQIANELNLSTVYVSSVYKASTGITFSQQLLNVRMLNAERLLTNHNLPTAKVAEYCGFCDESYFRKTFKKYFKINIKDYRNMKNGITLYHDKPLRKK